MTPNARQWTEEKLTEWRAKRDALIGWDDFRAIGLDGVVKRLEARLATAGPAAAVPSAVELLRVRIAAIAPRPHRHYPQVTVGTGSIMAALRHDLEARLAELTGEAAPAAPALSFRDRMREREAALGPPDHDPAPFAAGDQMAMFG